MLEYNNCVID